MSAAVLRSTREHWSRHSQKIGFEELPWTFLIKNHCHEAILFTHSRMSYCPLIAPITRRTGSITRCDFSFRNLTDSGVEKILRTSWTRGWDTEVTQIISNCIEQRIVSRCCPEPKNIKCIGRNGAWGN